MNCHQLNCKQVVPTQNPAQQLQQHGPSKLGALSATNGTAIQHHVVLFQDAATDIRICIPCSRNPRIVDKSHKAMFCPNYPAQTPSHATSLSLTPLSSQPFQAQQGASSSQGYSNPPGGSHQFQPY